MPCKMLTKSDCNNLNIALSSKGGEPGSILACNIQPTKTETSAKHTVVVFDDHSMKRLPLDSLVSLLGYPQ